MEVLRSNQVCFFCYALVFSFCNLFDVVFCYTGNQKAVAKHICRTYPTRFRKLVTAETCVSRVMTRVNFALENGDGGATPDLM